MNQKYRGDQQFWENQHKMVTETPFVWFMSAEQLRYSYKILADNANIAFQNRYKKDATLEDTLNNSFSASMMLAGFGIENYLKGILIKSDPAGAFDSKNKFKYSHHKLCTLANDAQMPLSIEENELLEVLEYFMVNGGRYPVPLKSDDMLPVEFNDGSIRPIGSQYYDNVNQKYMIYAKIDLFFHRLQVICPITD